MIPLDRTLTDKTYRKNQNCKENLISCSKL